MASTQFTSSTSPTTDEPIIVVDRRRRGFFTIDNELLDRFGAQLKAHGLAVYMALARFANQDGACWPSLSTIARKTGVSRPQVIREIAKLKELNLIAVEHQVNEKGEYSSNRYILLDLDPHSSEKGVVSGRDQGSITQIPPIVSHRYQGSRSLRPKQHPENKIQAKQDTEEQSPVVIALMAQGISEKVARKLAENHSQVYIEEKLAYLAFLQDKRPEMVLKPCGWLRKAIEEDYAVPDGYMTAEEKEAELIEAKQREEELRHQEEAEQERQCQIAEAQLADLRTAFGTTQQEIDLWNPLLHEFKLSMPAGSFHTCVANTVLLSLKNGEALIGLPNAHARDWLENRLAAKIRRTLSSCLGGQKVTVRFIDMSTLSRSGTPVSG